MNLQTMCFAPRAQQVEKSNLIGFIYTGSPSVFGLPAQRSGGSPVCVGVTSEEPEACRCLWITHSAYGMNMTGLLGCSDNLQGG